MRLMIRHNAEIAHRLSLTSGKCQQIHGHSLQIQLTLTNLSEGSTGMALNSDSQELDFSALKKKFRAYIDTSFDHHLLLNQNDPWAQLVDMGHGGECDWQQLPGLTIVEADPTIENLCKWWAEWAAANFHCDVICAIDETSTNGAAAYVTWNGFDTKVMK